MLQVDQTSSSHSVLHFFLLLIVWTDICASASFSGSRIILRQVSFESPSIYDVIIKLHKHCDGDWSKYVSSKVVSKESIDYFLEYSTQFLGNLGNYKGFGDVKFIPRCSKEDVQKLCEYANIDERERKICLNGMFVADNASQASMLLGFPDKGHVSGYYLGDPVPTQDEIDTLSTFVSGKGVLPENTRVQKAQDGNFEILVASALTKPSSNEFIDTQETKWIIDDGHLKGKTITLVFGDHQEEMSRIALNMAKAAPYSANERQQKMINKYAESFRTGSNQAFKESQKLWVKDIGPSVESNIGFIETYRDPSGIRGEWEGFAAMINKERTLAFKKLVDAAPAMIPKLPWSSDFEKDKFTPPDFTSLEVLSFVGSGIPSGINIPNHDDIRQNFGFKNVSLGNVLSAKGPNETVPFIHPKDLDVYQDNRDTAFEVQVGIHELLGHGSGKLLQETTPGVFNFDAQNPPVSPITNEPITTYYKPHETWGSVFGPLASSYEECRAECVAMALSCDFNILGIFGLDNDNDDKSTPNLHSKAGDVLYASYLSMARAGLLALEHWDPTSEKWGQIHMQARYSILKTFLEVGDGFCQIEDSSSAGGKPEDHQQEGLIIRLDRSKILTHGRPAVEKYLQQLHIFKSTADLEAGKRLYAEKTKVEGEFWQKRVRDEVIRKKLPRKVFVMANTVIEGDGRVELKEYEATLGGMVKSWAEREV